MMNILSAALLLASAQAVSLVEPNCLSNEEVANVIDSATDDLINLAEDPSY